MLALESVRLNIPDGANVIFGQSHFIKTVEDLYEALTGAGPHLQFGIAFSEASGPCLVRADGNDHELKQTAIENLLAVAAGHAFLIVLRGGFPISVLDRVRSAPEVCTIFCATANPVEVVVARSEQGGAVLGVIDGSAPKGVESEEHIVERHGFLRRIGYKR